MIPIQNSTLSSASASASGTAAAVRRAGSAAGSAGSPVASPLATGVAAAQAGPMGATTEQVSLSGVGQMLNLASTQGATPPASDARIAELQNAIRSGQYGVDTQRIAKGLLQDSRALIGASQPASN